ncbi:MAG: helix-turn-helix transcriptional regulator [Candidatus Magnetobacterium sp. LHC-1]|nr:helix-turn-helix transcriptional regulator [Nitrospirota bacterium]
MIGKKIKELRLLHGLTQAEFAKRLGITSTAISSIEQNRTYPSYLLLKKIVEEFKIDGGWLFSPKK